MPFIAVSNFKIKKLPPESNPHYHLYKDNMLIFSASSLDETLNHLFYRWQYEQRLQIAKMEAETEIKITVSER
ncbi:hypothetical protein [Mannheimia bovis]|uniref:Uncharacterized protein n=1 Tax=Mannheimia bovis TaxID=2770636 RepID=A0A7H1BZW0_9PAST|nr:hypothetical protein [Mannheimia bovis]QNS14265.1 hypothetical protein ICJ55_05680 [Mannheimia bovis]